MNKLFDRFEEKELTEFQRHLLSKIAIISRAKSEDKIKVISLFIKLGKRPAMCGDGTNDVGAINKAELGLYLSNNSHDPPVPFSSTTSSISSMLILIRECRASFSALYSLFNIMILYCMIQTSTTVITELCYELPSLPKYFYWDICCNFIFLVLINFTKSS